jgi:hypothetical protein
MTLCKIHFVVKAVFTANPPLSNTDALGASACEVFGAMLRGDISLNLEVPPFRYFGGYQRLLESHIQPRIEQRLNAIGCGRLLASLGHVK